MGIYLNIPAQTRAIIEQCMTDILDVGNMGQRCLLYMPPTPTFCANCVPDPIGMKSGNIYITGGPQPFENGQVCPMCHGDYILDVQETISVVMSIECKPERFLDIMRRTVRFPKGVIQTRGFVDDLQAVINCSNMETFIDKQTDHYTFKLHGEPVVAGTLARKFFYALWERV